MRRLKLWLALAVLAAALAVGAGAAVSPQHTSPVVGTLGATRVAVHEITCGGDDGQYRQAVETYTGGLGGDPRLTGPAVFYLTSITNMTSGYGTAQGVLVVTDLNTHVVKVRAAFVGVATGSGGSNMRGLLTGTVADFGSQPGGRLVANLEAVKNGISLYAAIGQAGTNLNPAVIQRSHCSPSPALQLGK